MLEKEIEVFEKNLPSFLKEHREEFVLIKDEEIEFFKTQEEAVERGLEKYGTDSGFLVREVLKNQREIQMPAYTSGILTNPF